jgi:hypothetical protein
VPLDRSGDHSCFGHFGATHLLLLSANRECSVP